MSNFYLNASRGPKTVSRVVIIRIAIGSGSNVQNVFLYKNANNPHPETQFIIIFRFTLAAM
jgi:hypothetical protein